MLHGGLFLSPHAAKLAPDCQNTGVFHENLYNEQFQVLAGFTSVLLKYATGD